MSYTKRQFIELAFDEIGLGYPYSINSDQYEPALKKLDAMMAQWNAKGIRVGYPIPSSPENSDIADETNVPDSANAAIYLNLAIRIAPSFGKQLSIETKQYAKQSYNTLLSITTMPQERQITGLPKGAGNKPYRLGGSDFMPPPTDPLLAGQDGELDFN